ncbi:hypothetical protein M422DRAFT_267796 [Sphaerobolus stellatus SS14]|uniref:Uncharacterized protein n=1 Tax=Sphaerobolus stellatus (strain SS14) TaxID=990650 RepID=A0A0C9UP18_SPHS4|nr:hypothetical protein M422DRAFT_267796 [Sphaerobolus stellatus SS14]
MEYAEGIDVAKDVASGSVRKISLWMHSPHVFTNYVLKIEDNDICLPSIMTVVWIREVTKDEQSRLAEEDGEGAEALARSYSTKKRIN